MTVVILAGCITGGFIISTTLFVLYCWIRSIWTDRSQEKILFIWRSYVAYSWKEGKGLPDIFIDESPHFRHIDDLANNFNRWDFWYVLEDNTGKSILKAYYKSNHFMKNKDEVDTYFREMQKWIKD